MALNAAWHSKNPMPRNATLDQRIEWHIANARACGCREIPASVLKELRRRGAPVPKRRRARAMGERDEPTSSKSWNA